MGDVRHVVGHGDQGAVISADLHSALAPGEMVGLLIDFGLTDRDIARATGANVRSVRRWRAGLSPSRSAEQIDALRVVVAFLRDSEAMTDASIAYWLRARNRTLEDQAPLDVLRVGLFEFVKAAAAAYVDPEAPLPPSLPAEARAALTGMADDATDAQPTPLPGRRKLRLVS